MIKAIVSAPETIGGLALVLPVALAAYRGWIGGIAASSTFCARRSRR